MNFFLNLIVSACFLCACSDITEPGKVESRVEIADWVFGNWQIKNNDDKQVIVQILRDGSALGDDGSIGSWYYMDGYLHIVWTTGWVDLITKKSGAFIKSGYAPGVATDKPPTNESKAVKLSD